MCIIHPGLTLDIIVCPMHPNHQSQTPETVRARCPFGSDGGPHSVLTLYLPVSATLQGIGDDPVVVRDKRGYIPLRKTSKNRIWDCGLLGSMHMIVFGGEKSWKQLRSIWARDMMMMMNALHSSIVHVSCFTQISIKLTL